MDIIRNMVRTIIDKIKSLFEEDKIEVEPKIIKKEIRYNKHGFPTYNPRVQLKSKSNNQNRKY